MWVLALQGMKNTLGAAVRVGWAHFCALVLQDKRTWGMAFGIELQAQVSRCLRLRMVMILKRSPGVLFLQDKSRAHP